MFADLYREEILEHYKSPLNFGKLKGFNLSAKAVNPFCGDEIEMFLKLTKNKIKNVGFIGKGCAISIASASLLSEYAKNKSKSQLTKFSENNMLELLDVDLSETRKKCAFLALSVLRDCLYGLQSKS